MKVLTIGFIIVMILTFSVPPVGADEVAELKAMVEQLRNDYESKISVLEAKIEVLESNQNLKVNQKVAALREEMMQEIKDSTMNIEYVGRNQDKLHKGGVRIETPSGFGKVSLGGYMDHEFESFEGSHSTFDQHRWIINIGAEIGERLRFFSEYEIEHGGPDAGGEAKVEQAWVDYLISDWINFRAGAVLVPFGRTNIYHDSDLRDLTSRPLVARDIIPTTWTESGLGFHGEFAPTLGEYEDLELAYEVYVINGLDDGFTDNGLGGAKGSLASDNNNSKAVVGRLVASPALGHEIAYSNYWGRYNTMGDDITGHGIDFLSKWGPLELEGEYAIFNVDQPVGGADIADKFQGYSIQASYHFWPEFLNDSWLGRSFEDPTFTLVGRYGWAQIDDDADSTETEDNEEDRFTLGLNYRPVESWVMKLEYQWNDTDFESLERGNANGWFWSIAMGF